MNNAFKYFDLLNMKIARKELSSTLLAISLKSFEESVEF